MAILKQNGYSHNPHSLRDQFRNKKTFCRLCGELECQSCEPVSFFQVFAPIVALCAVLLALAVTLSYWNDQKAIRSQPQPPKVAVYVDQYGNMIETQMGVHLGRGIQSEWEIQK